MSMSLSVQPPTQKLNVNQPSGPERQTSFWPKGLEREAVVELPPSETTSHAPLHILPHGVARELDRRAECALLAARDLESGLTVLSCWASCRRLSASHRALAIWRVTASRPAAAPPERDGPSPSFSSTNRCEVAYMLLEYAVAIKIEAQRT